MARTGRFLLGKEPCGLIFTKLEQNGVLHALQILIENSIGKAKQILKARNVVIPVSAYDAFSALAVQGGN